MTKQQWQADQKRLAEVYSQNPEYGRDRLAKAAGVHECTAQRFLKKHRGSQPQPLPQKNVPPPKPITTPPAENVSTDYSADKASITTTSSKITNLDQALAAAHVDLNKWEVTRHTVNH